MSLPLKSSRNSVEVAFLHFLEYVIPLIRKIIHDSEKLHFHPSSVAEFICILSELSKPVLQIFLENHLHLVKNSWLRKSKHKKSNHNEENY